jgi:uncharacterized protein (UPF0335 family)
MKHTFTKSQIKRILLEELTRSQIEDDAKEIVDEVKDLLSEAKGNNFLTKVYEKIFSKSQSKKYNPKETEDLAYATYKELSRKQLLPKVGAALVFSAFLAGLNQYTDQALETRAAPESSVDFAKAVETGTAKASEITSFVDMAQASAEGVQPVSEQEDINKALDELRSKYATSFKVAPITPGIGIFADGDPTNMIKGFTFVPSEKISDDQILPFVGMTKGDYEQLLKATYAGESGKQRLNKIVMGGGRGSSGFWAYQDDLYAPVVSKRSSREVKDRMVDLFGQEAEVYGILPLEWSVAKEVLDSL